MEWTSQDDIEGECAPTQLVPASQACDLAEESALEFNPDQSQDAWGATAGPQGPLLFLYSQVKPGSLWW